MARRSIVAVCMLLGCLSFYSTQATAVSPDRPDIIVVMVDDLGAIDEKILERLPNIRSLWLNHGLRFDAAYSETPLCCPGRASFLTGQHTRRHGVVVNDARLLDPRHTIATALQDAGYYTFMVGKYLNGAQWLSDHTPVGWDHAAMLDEWSTNVTSEWWVDDLPLTAGHMDRFVADKSLELLSGAPADQPVFAWVTPHAPHEANATGAEWLPDVEPRYAGDPRCDGINPWRPPSYDFPIQPAGFPLEEICRSLLTVDDIVGDLRSEARSQGRDPVWVFMSDNGMAWGADGYVMKNVPQAGRLPLYFFGPGVVEGATSALVSNIDIGPTLAKLAGTDMPRAQGRSFERVLRGEGGGRNAMLEDHPVGGETGHGPSGPWWGVRTRQWHLVEWNGTHLYDLEADPWELNDVIEEHLEEAVRLADRRNRPLSILQPTPSPSIPVASPTASPTAPPTASPTVSPAASQTDLPSPTFSPPPPSSSATAGPTQPAGVTPKPTDTPSSASSPSPTETAAGAEGPLIGAPGSGSGLPAVLIAVIAIAVAGLVLLVARPLFRSRPTK